MMGNAGGFFGATGQEANLVDHFGDLLFVNNFSNTTVYQATLKDLRAKNTLFICLADYCGESFQRAFGELSMTNT